MREGVVCQCASYVLRVGGFECTELGGPDAGRVKAVLHPISAQWENGYSTPTTGSILVATQDPSAEDVWAGATGLYISQVMPDGSRRCRFGGEILSTNGAGGGAFNIAVRSIDGFLDDRLVAGPECGYGIDYLTTLFRVYKPLPTNPVTFQLLFSETIPDNPRFGAALVNFARGGLEGEGVTGIPTLTAVGEASGVFTPQLVRWWDHKNVGEWVRYLSELESPASAKYQLEHTFSNGYWSTLMRFKQAIGQARDYTIRSDIEAKEYGLQVDASEKATRVYGIGAGEENDTLFSVAYDADGVDNLPERHATVAWKDQTVAALLDSQTAGYVTDHRDPVTVPSATLYGLPDYDPDAAGYDPQKGFPGPEILEPGDTFDVQIGYGAITVHDLEARCLAVSWELATGAPAKRTIAMQPVIRANNSIRTQTPARVVSPTQPIPEGDIGDPHGPIQAQSIPWPPPGLVARSQSADLTEISGMQYSKANPGYIWVVEDEQETPDQVSLLKRSTGERVGYFNVTGVSAAPVGDPEALRLARQSGKLVIADIGDNNNNRPTSGANQPSLLVVTEPKGGGAKGTLPTVRYPIAYPSGLQVNAETLLIHPTSEQVYIVTKEDTQARVYSYGVLSSMSTVNNVGTLVATLGISAVTDGTHTFAGDFVLFRTAKVSATQVYKTAPWGKVGEIATPPMAKSEAITTESACAFLTTTEGVNAPIYRVLIPKQFGATCNTTAGPDETGSGGEGPNGPNVVPGQVINMQGWKLQLPI